MIEATLSVVLCGLSFPAGQSQDVVSGLRNGWALH